MACDKRIEVKRDELEERARREAEAAEAKEEEPLPENLTA